MLSCMASLVMNSVGMDTMSIRWEWGDSLTLSDGRDKEFVHEEGETTNSPHCKDRSVQSNNGCTEHRDRQKKSANLPTSQRLCVSEESVLVQS